MPTSKRIPLVLLAGALAWGGATRTMALNVQIEGPTETSKIDFGVLSSSVVYNTAPQSLKITHPSQPFRKIYVFTDNNAGFGMAEAGVVGPGGTFPLHFRNFTTKPSTVQFTATEADVWPLLLDSSSPGFSANKETGARVYPGTDFISYVHVGLEIPPSSRGRGGFGARLVVEDWSDYEDVLGPTVAPAVFSTLILLNDVPVGISAVLTDQNDVVDYTLFYRMEDGPPEFQSAKGDPPRKIEIDGAGPYPWRADVSLDPSYRLRAPGVLEYYFTAVDTFTNVSESVHYRSNLVPESGTASLPYSKDAGGVGVAVGDPRWPGLSMMFPAGSLRSGGTMTVALKDPSTFPSLEGKKPARVFQVGPTDLSFLHPVTILVPYSDRDNNGKEDGTETDETALRLFWYDGFDWRYVGGTVDAASNQVRANVTHLGLFGFFPAGPLTADLVRPKERILTFNYPNDLLRFTGVDPTDGSFDIEIFDVRGSLVRKIHNFADWDGRDESGSRVESGTYVYRFEGQGLTLTGMIAVAR